MVTEVRGDEDPTADLAGALAALVGLALGVDTVAIEGLRRLSGGASRETWAFDAVPHGSVPGGDDPDRDAPDGDVPDPGVRHRLILQRQRAGPHLGGPTMAAEDTLLRAAAGAGVPLAPLVVDVATAAPALGEARVTGHVDGETLGPRIVRTERDDAARAALVGQMGRALAAIHSIDPTTVTGLVPVEPLQRLRDGLDLVGEARPAFELALRWLAANRPPASAPGVVHGDFRVGNLIIDGADLRAVLDWELAHLGDPLEDLGWLCVRSWRFGGDREVGGIGDLDDLLAAYGEARGATVDPAAVRWWTVVGTLTWGLICAVQARRHLDGHVRSVELATIGRRVCETEHDLLDLLGVAPSPTTPTTGEHAATTDADPGLHGRPTAAELVDAVRSHLTDAVLPALSGATAFHTKVAVNALAMVERELRLSRAMAAAQAERLATLALSGVTDERALAAAIRAGDLDDRADVAAAVRAAVTDRLRVANPRWLVPATDPTTPPRPPGP